MAPLPPMVKELQSKRLLWRLECIPEPHELFLEIESNIMQAVLFDTSKHLDEVHSWCDGWKMNHFQEGWLPTYGAIVPGYGVAWLYFSDSDVAWIENIISNPAADEEGRKIAIDLVINHLESVAREQGTKWLLGSSTNRSVIDRAIDDHGYRARKTFQLMKIL
jgi:hypothetical protein